LWQIVATCLVSVVVAGFVIWLGIFLWARYAILIVTNLTWGLAAIGWASLMTVTEMAPMAGESKRGPRSVRAKLFGLFTAGIGFCVGIPLIYDAFRNPIFPSHRPGGPWDVEFSVGLTVKLLIFVPIPYAFLAFVVSERWHEWRIWARRVASTTAEG
jgi:hypothetical protein